MKPLNVLSLFDGMSCGQIALQRLGIPIANYFASEIDKHAIKVTMANFPNTIQLGDVTKVDGIDLPEIDLLIGGSPCQGFSFAGKQLNFNDPRSALFFEFVRLLKEYNPKYFFLENVKMKKDYQDVITQYLGLEPIEFNSALVSAQNRKRLYWTNIPGFVVPEDKNIFLSDILTKDTNAYENLKASEAQINRALNAKRSRAVYDNAEKLPTILANQGKNGTDSVYLICPLSEKVRILSRAELEASQTIPVGYTEPVSYSRAATMLGNGWTIDAICEFFKHIKQPESILSEPLDF